MNLYKGQKVFIKATEKQLEERGYTGSTKQKLLEGFYGTIENPNFSTIQAFGELTTRFTVKEDNCYVYYPQFIQKQTQIRKRKG